jgi:hypothetical protein
MQYELKPMSSKLLPLTKLLFKGPAEERFLVEARVGAWVSSSRLEEEIEKAFFNAPAEAGTLT